MTDHDVSRCRVGCLFLCGWTGTGGARTAGGRGGLSLTEWVGRDGGELFLQHLCTYHLMDVSVFWKFYAEGLH